MVKIDIGMYNANQSLNPLQTKHLDNMNDNGIFSKAALFLLLFLLLFSALQ